MPRSSLKNALIISFLLVGVIPTLLFGLSAVDRMEASQLAGINELNAAHAVDVSEDVTEFMNEIMADLLVARDVLAEFDKYKIGTADDFLQLAVQHSNFFESIYLLDEKRHVIALGVTPDLAPRIDDYIDLDLSSHNIFQKNQAISKPVWSDTFVSLVTGEPSITLAMPIGQWTLFGNVNLKRLSQLLQRYSVGRHSEFAVIDQEGTLVAHSNPERASQRVNFTDHPVVRLGLQGKTATSEHQHLDKRTLESVTNIPVTNWVAWVGLDLGEVLAPVHRLRSLLFGFMALAILSSIIAAMINVRRLMQPLINLGDQAGRIAEGDYSARIDRARYHEIDELGSRFEVMAQSVQEREEAILSSERRFRNLVNSIEGVVYELDLREDVVRFVSERMVEMLGYSTESLVGKPGRWNEITHPDDLQAVMAWSREMVATGGAGHYDYRMLHSSGEVRWVRDLVTVIRGEDSVPVELGVLIDVTRQKKLEMELRRSERNYREIFNATGEAIFIHDPQTGQILDANQVVFDMFGFSRDQILSKTLNEISLGESPYSMADAVDRIRQAFETGGMTFLWRSRRATGELFWSEVALRRAVIGEEGRVIAAVRDVTDRKRAEEQLQELNDRLQLLIERMPFACIVWTPDFEVDLWNPMAKRIFGFTAEEMMGRKPYGVILAPKWKEPVAKVWQRLCEGDVTAHSINENITKDGRVISCEWFNTPIFTSSGNLTGVISMCQDISDRRAAEKELAKYQTHLEELVAERTKQLEDTQAELVKTERLAVLGQLTATVSHEIRNPLGTLANALFLIRNEIEAGGLMSLERPLKLAERNVSRCDGIISELLDFSRKRRLNLVPLEVDPWLNELLEELSWPDRVELYGDLASGATVKADPERLRRAVINAITNALQAMEEREDRASRLAIKTGVSNGRLEIQISDNGLGIPPENLERIFEPMFSTKNFGVGLGVPIIKNILEDHGGDLEYQSEEGVGTTVTLWLPLK